MRLSLSIVTPSYNQGYFIERTLLSVLSQSDPADEYVVFDGGSNDETTAILAKFGDSLVWTSQRDRGQSDAVNKGIRATSGDIIGWLNSDDIYYPGAFEKVRQYFADHPDVDVVYGKSNHIDEGDGVIEPYPTEEWSLERMKDICVISQPAAFFRRSIVEKFGGLDESLQFCMDYEFWLRLAQSGAKFAYLPKLLAATRIHGQTKTNASRLKCHHEINDMLSKRFGSVPDRWVFNYAHAAVEDRGISKQRRMRFVSSLVLHSCVACVKWNRRLRWSVIKLTHGWMWHHFRLALAGGRR